MIVSYKIPPNDYILVEDFNQWWFNRRKFHKWWRSTQRRLHSICSAEDLYRLVWLLFSHKAVRRSLCTISCEILFVSCLFLSAERERAVPRLPPVLRSTAASSVIVTCTIVKHHDARTPWSITRTLSRTDGSVESIRSVLITIRNHNFRYLSSNTFIAT